MAIVIRGVSDADQELSNGSFVFIDGEHYILAEDQEAEELRLICLEDGIQYGDPLPLKKGSDYTTLKELRQLLDNSDIEYIPVTTVRLS